LGGLFIAFGQRIRLYLHVNMLNSAAVNTFSSGTQLLSNLTSASAFADKLPAAFLDATREVMPAGLSLDDFIAACQRPLRPSLRVNTLKISVADFLALARDYQWDLEPIPWCAEGFGSDDMSLKNLV